MLSAAEASDCVLPAHSVSVISDIPLKKGLGSSAAARVAGYAAGKILCGKDVNPEEIALEAAIIEGHPDNVYPAALGGLVASAPEKVSGRQNYMYLRREVPDNIRFVVGIPASEVETDSSRKVLPDKVSLADVVYSSSRALLLFEALSSGKIEGINRIMDDRIHQPFRQKFIESYEEVSCAALNAGAKGVAICGSGPSIYAVSDVENSHRVGEAIVREWEDREIYSEYLILSGYSGNIGESIEKIVGFDE